MMGSRGGEGKEGEEEESLSLGEQRQGHVRTQQKSAVCSPRSEFTHHTMTLLVP